MIDVKGVERGEGYLGLISQRNLPIEESKTSKRLAFKFRHKGRISLFTSIEDYKYGNEYVEREKDMELFDKMGYKERKKRRNFTLSLKYFVFVDLVYFLFFFLIIRNVNLTLNFVGKKLIKKIIKNMFSLFIHYEENQFSCLLLKDCYSKLPITKWVFVIFVIFFSTQIINDII